MQNISARNIRILLENFELKIILESPANDYRLEYFTTAQKDRRGGEPRLTRAYRLLDLTRKTVTASPWDDFDVRKQPELIENLINISKYKITSIIYRWRATCPECRNMTEGKIWESITETCMEKRPKKCGAKIAAPDIVEIPFSYPLVL